jgi:hypothetical protein
VFYLFVSARTGTLNESLSVQSNNNIPNNVNCIHVYNNQCQPIILYIYIYTHFSRLKSIFFLNMRLVMMMTSDPLCMSIRWVYVCNATYSYYSEFFFVWSALSIADYMSYSSPKLSERPSLLWTAGPSASLL